MFASVGPESRSRHVLLYHPCSVLYGTGVSTSLAHIIASARTYPISYFPSLKSKEPNPDQFHSCTVTSSRVVYAYSRDGALPGSRWWKKVNRHTKTPVNAVWFVVTIGALLGLLMFASPVAIGAVFSIGAIAQYVAFTFPVALKLFCARGKFRPGELRQNEAFSFFYIFNLG